MHEGLYESLLTDQLNQDLAARPDVRPQIAAVDGAEQPLTLARHLSQLIERALRTAKAADERAQLTRRSWPCCPPRARRGAAASA